jgi:acetyltransferase
MRVVCGINVKETARLRSAVPVQYVTEWTADGTKKPRPLRPEDEPLMVKFHESLSDRSVYMRFMHPMLLSQRAAHVRLSRICHGDYDREITLIADRHDDGPDELRVLAASRMSKIHGENAARFSLLVSDCCQHMGIGKEIMKRMLDVGRQEKISRLEVLMTHDNQACDIYANHLASRSPRPMTVNEAELSL